MAKPDSPPTPLTDMALGRGPRTTMSLFRNPITGGIERPKPAPAPEPKPAEPPPAGAKPDPADEELAALRARQTEIADIRRAIDKHDRDLKWFAGSGTKAPF